MDDIAAVRQRLDRVFRDAFRVSDLAEPLATFDGTCPTTEARRVLTRRKIGAAGVVESGFVAGYVLTSDLAGTGTCETCRREFEPEDVVPDDLPLVEGLLRLGTRDRLFVAVFGQVVGIVTRQDVQKPVARMWLFGLMTLLELTITQLIELWHGDDGWKDALSPGRLRKAADLRAERERLHGECGLSLLDCLQFADKTQIVLRHEATRQLFSVGSKAEGERLARRVARLRDVLAHSQHIAGDDLRVVLRFARGMDGMLATGAALSGRWRGAGAAPAAAP